MGEGAAENGFGNPTPRIQLERAKLNPENRKPDSAIRNPNFIPSSPAKDPHVCSMLSLVLRRTAEDLLKRALDVSVGCANHAPSSNRGQNAVVTI